MASTSTTSDINEMTVMFPVVKRLDKIVTLNTDDLDLEIEWPRLRDREWETEIQRERGTDTGIDTWCFMP